jgi:hypothetical protein
MLYAAFGAAVLHALLRDIPRLAMVWDCSIEVQMLLDAIFPPFDTLCFTGYPGWRSRFSNLMVHS